MGRTQLAFQPARQEAKRTALRSTIEDLTVVGFEVRCDPFDNELRQMIVGGAMEGQLSQICYRGSQANALLRLLVFIGAFGDIDGGANRQCCRLLRRKEADVSQEPYLVALPATSRPFVIRQRTLLRNFARKLARSCTSKKRSPAAAAKSSEAAV